MTHALRATWNRAAATLDRLIGMDAVLAVSRVGIAAVFFYSGRTKVDGYLHVTDNAKALFRDEYRLPFVDASVAAYGAAYAEHLFPILLVLGLATRLSALALLVMTLIIEVFVYPDAWPTHVSWAASLLLLAAKGGGNWSFDRVLGLR